MSSLQIQAFFSSFVPLSSISVIQNAPDLFDSGSLIPYFIVDECVLSVDTPFVSEFVKTVNDQIILPGASRCPLRS